MSEEDPEQFLKRKFPKMKPVKSAPGLGSVNGFGIGMAGSRDFDAETGTYVKTKCITALFIPVYALSAYRVADAEGGGWYFLGKVEKSTFAKIWNTMLFTGVALMIAFGWWTAKTGSDDYIAKKHIKEAKAFEANGNHIGAVETYLEVLLKKLPQRDAAIAGVERNAEEVLSSDSAAEGTKLINLVADLPDWLPQNEQFLPKLPAQALASARRHTPIDAPGAHRLLEACGRLRNPPENLREARRKLLEKLVKDLPGEKQYLMSLAGIYEEEQMIEEALALLDPIKDSLGETEGARIYGQLLVSAGRPDEAIGYLKSYTDSRLQAWRTAAKNYDSAAERAYQKVIDDLNNNKGPQSFYTRYEAASNPDEESAIVDEYVFEKMKYDSSYQRAIREYERASILAPVIMDLGIAELRSAQSAADPEKRKALLTSAEKHFLSIQETTGGSSESQFFLGQVYFWSGQQEKGRKEFDDLLASSGRGVSTLLTLSRTLREVGDVSEARALSEEAHKKASTDEERDEAAGQRALLSTDIDDQIAWLEKLSGKGATDKIRLSASRAEKALEDGDKVTALKHLRMAADGWAQLPASPSSLNNGALVELRLFNLTGDLSHHGKGGEMMDRAVALSPEDSIVVLNASSVLQSNGMMQIVKDAVHPRIVQEGVGFSTFRFLYDSESERASLIKKMLANDNYRRGMELMEKALVLAPNRRDLYFNALGHYQYAQNAEAMKGLVEKLKRAQVDHSEAKEEFAKNLSGENDEDLRKATDLSIENQEKMLKEIDDPRQQAFVKVSIAETRLSLWGIDETTPDLNAQIAFLRDEVANRPSSRVRSALTTALGQKACDAIARRDPAFAKVVKGARRELGGEFLVVLGLTSEKFRPAILASTEARELFAAHKAQNDHYPANFDSIDWIIARYTGDPKAEQVKAAVLANGILSAGLDFTGEVAPWSAATVMGRYLYLLVQGREDDASSLLAKARADGVPVPEL